MTGWVPEVNYLPSPLSNKTTWPLHKGVSIELSETPLNASSGQSIWPPMMFQQVFFQDCKRPLELTIPFKTVHHPEFQEAFQWADASAHKKKKGPHMHFWRWDSAQLCGHSSSHVTQWLHSYSSQEPSSQGWGNMTWFSPPWAWQQQPKDLTQIWMAAWRAGQIEFQLSWESWNVRRGYSSG